MSPSRTPQSTAPTPAAEPTGTPESILGLVEILHKGARDADELSALADAPLNPGGVALLLGATQVRSVTPEELTDHETWTLPVDIFAGYTGPFSALDHLARADRLTVTAGPRPHCASSPRPAPSGYARLTRVAIESAADLSSCLDWFVVNLYVDGHGLVRAIQLDLYEP